MRGMKRKFSYTHIPPSNKRKKNNKLWCCANSAIELVDTVKTNKHTNITKNKNKTITGDNSANGRGNIFTKI